MTREVKLYELEKPRQWQAGSIGERELYFDCGECDAKAPEIAGFLATGPSYAEVMLLKKVRGYLPAFLCQACFQKYRRDCRQQDPGTLP